MILHSPFGGRPPTASGNTRSSWDLLEQVSATALDEDYARAATERAKGPDPDRPRRPGALGAIALVGLGGLLTLAAVQTREAAPVDNRERAELISQINERKAEVSRLNDLTEQVRQDVEELQGTAQRIDNRGEDLLATLSESQLLSGAVPVTGPGLQIVVDDAESSESTSGGTVQDVDLQVLVNGLWQAGAEAIAINDNRLGSLSAIHFAGSAITVNFRSLTRPYVIKAIGDPDRLEADFAETPGGQAWFDLETNYGIQFAMETVDELTLPAVPERRLNTVYAKRQGELP